MKKFLLSLLSLTILVASVNAQGDPKKALKTAKKALASYNLDQENNRAKLDEAAKAIDEVAADATMGNTAAVLLKKGEIYAAMANADFIKLSLDPTYEIKDLAAAQKGYDAYKKAYEVAEKKFEKKDALDGVSKVSGNLQNAGITIFRQGNYASAFELFTKSIESDDFVVANGGVTRFDPEANPKSQANFLRALAGEQIGEKEVAGKIYKELIAENYDSPSIYSGMYKMTKDTDIDAALGYLDQGIEKYPDDNGLLFDKINYFLENEKREELIENLKKAIEKEPKNVSLYNVMANTYDKLSQDAAKNGEAETAENYFNSALDYFGQALKIDPENSSANYGLGTLYYNKAAVFTQEIKDLEEQGYSNAILKQISAKEDEMKNFFGKAMPFFEKAYNQDSSDRNTIIALKEIYARTNQLEKSNEMKALLEKMAGGEN